MGPEFWKPDKTTKLKKCSEFRSDSCDPAETDGCCAVIPCTYCLDWVGSYSDTGEAGWTGTGWSGIVNGWLVLMFWERGYLSGECEFVVTVDGVEVYRNDCYGGQSCRDSSDSTAATIDGQEGTLTWTKLEPRPLEYVADPDAPGCQTWFCGTCECTCTTLCLIITPLAAELGACYGEAADMSYPCDAPHWLGSVTCSGNTYDVDLTLARDDYGNCVIRGSVDGVDVEDRTITDCGAINETWTLYDGTTVQVVCKRCDCGSGRTGCCPNLPDTIYLTVDADYETGVLTLINIVDGETAIWETPAGQTTTITDCDTITGNQTSYAVGRYATVSCGPDGLTVNIKDSPGGTELFVAVFSGCYGGTLCDTDPEVTVFQLGGSCKDYFLTGPRGCVSLSA
jgi:hypothetical protein